MTRPTVPPETVGRRERLRDVLETLSRHGLGFALAALGLDRRFPFDRRRRLAEPPAGTSTLPQRVRRTFEELGPTYIKLGQIVSTRPDLIPPEYAAELAKLQDSAPPVPVATVRAALADELGERARLLEHLEEAPLASASIGQVHAARFDGTDVVVKVRRPGVVEEIGTDLDILRELANRANRASALAADYDVAGFVEDFAQTLRAELDYIAEAHNAERFAATFADDPRVHIPRVVWETTTARVLTLERIRGIKISDAAALDAAGIDRRDLAERACSVLLKMVFEDGFFHADPHPGNFFIEPGGRIGIIDFGMVGRIDDKLREQLVRMLLALVTDDAVRVTAILVELCGTPRTGDVAGLQSQVARLLDRYVGRPMAEVPLVRIITDLVALLRQYHLRLPRETALLVKMIVMADGLGKQLDPDFDIMSVLTPYAPRLMLSTLAPEAVLRRLRQMGVDLLQLGLDAPGFARRLAAVLERGGFDVHLRTGELDPLMDRVERIGNRLVAGLITAALINAIGELVSDEPRQFHRWPGALFSAGIGGVAALGGYLAWTSRRPR